mgnify:FL=1|tara:strand:+ start:435 stop:626 length:192 start_codon:yes stop_codon:yes gene_type:complete
MALTFKDVCDKLEKLDEITLLEVLDISSEEIIGKFQDKIEDNFEELSEDLNDGQIELFNQQID